MASESDVRPFARDDMRAVGVSHFEAVPTWMVSLTKQERALARCLNVVGWQ